MKTFSDSAQELIDKYGAVVGFIGGIIGVIGGTLAIISFRFTLKNYILEHVKKPNRERYEKHFSGYDHKCCFSDTNFSDCDGYNTQVMTAFFDLVVSFKDKNENTFIGFKTKFRYWLLYKTAKKLNSIFDDADISWRIMKSGKNPERKKFVEAYHTHKKLILRFERRFKKFYRAIYGYYK